MQSYTDDNRKNKLYGAIATVLYVVMWLLLIFFVSFKIAPPADEGEGILINFGNSETGFGEEDLPNTDELASSPQASQQAAPDTPVEQMTQQTEEAPTVATRPDPVPRPTHQPPVERPTPVEEPPGEQTREVDQRTLFPGRTNGSTSTSEGTAGGTGNQGDPAGDPSGSHEGTGTGTSGVSYSLNGRSPVGALPKPDYPAREEGRVVVEIRVDQQGRVVATSFRSVGSTTTNSALVAAAERAAKQARFNVDETAPFPQVGTITYNFRFER